MGSHTLEVLSHGDSRLCFNSSSPSFSSELFPDSQSPRWLIAHCDVEQARKILADLEGLDAKGEHVTNDVKEIEFTVVFVREYDVSWGALLRGRTGDQGGTSTIRRLVLGMARK